MPAALVIPIGTRFARLVTTSNPYSVLTESGYRNRFADVRCDCGKVLAVRVSTLRNGNTKSCGCLNREVAAATGKARRIFDCGEPGCTGEHGWHSTKAAACPRSQREKAKAARKSGRKRYHERKQPSYVYAVIVNGVTLKIGKSEVAYGHQRDQTKQHYRARGLGVPETTEMVWRVPGDTILEQFVQSRAARTWTPLLNYTRASEWFDVTGVPTDVIIKNLERWHELEQTT